ncbi:AT-rich interactive domain-containing protein 1-like [Rutidosis leptorrhynchoides]|uniref:AT-rich interactive domain-containing protein 1-like n=1 Tax=Rutidosis leptorrhynchoides TaxID=125765 RepID=UPI003A9A473D
MDRFNYINDDNLKLAIPIGPRFQADVPEWRGPPQKSYPKVAFTETDSSKWLGTVIWSMKDPTQESETGVIGKGRSDTCDCAAPGSILCVKRHIVNKSAHLQLYLGPAFQIWKFDQMGEAVAKLWKQQEQHRLTNIMIKNPFSEGKDFITTALKCFPTKSKKEIISYYFNVYVPRRMSIQTRSGCRAIDTDDEEEKLKSSLKRPRKRARSDGTKVHSSKIVGSKYLIGRR